LIKSKKLSKIKIIKHGFFNKTGGKSKKIYKGLNCGPGSKDNLSDVKKNLQIVKKKIKSSAKNIFLLHQIHSNKFVFMKKFSKLNDIAFHLVNKVNKKKLKINTLILKNWEYIFGQNNKFVQLKKTIINNKTESVIFELRVSPEKSFEMHSKTNEIVIKIEEVTGVKVNKILFFQDLSDRNLENRNISNLSMKQEGKTLNNQNFNGIKDEEVRSIFENINKKLYENN